MRPYGAMILGTRQGARGEEPYRTLTATGAILALLLLPPPSHGEDDTTTNIGCSLVIGFTGTNTSPLICNGGSVTNATGTTGCGANADNNYVIVFNSGSLWPNDGQLFVGNLGSKNQLTILDAGMSGQHLGSGGDQRGEQ